MIIIYIGIGKGKTTAAVGLAVREAGAGKKVLFTQFVKAARALQSGQWPLSSEILILRKIPRVTVKIFGKGFVRILGDTKKRSEHIEGVKKGYQWLEKQIKSQKYNLVIADELISAVELKLLQVQEIRKLIRLARKKGLALVLTGHRKYPALLHEADLVTEMKMIKHYYYQGVVAQKGIDY